MHYMLLKDRVAIITGAGRGIGFGIASLFAEHGAKVVIIDISEELAKKAAEEIKSKGGAAFPYQADVTDKARVKEIVDDVVRKLDRIDILVNNVGIHRGAAFWEEPLEYYDIQFKVNVLGIVIPSQLVVPHMMKRRKGKIINISSKAALVGEPGHAAYSASKGAVLALTRAMAIELAPYNINVNAICPGPCETDMLFALTTEKDREEMSKRTPLKRLAKPLDVAGAALFLASDASDYITGQYIAVDGGQTIAPVERTFV